MNDEQHLRPHRGQAPAKGFDPELFRQFIENQAQELEIRREENEIKRQELELGYKHAAVVLAAQVMTVSASDNTIKRLIYEALSLSASYSWYSLPPSCTPLGWIKILLF